MNIPPRCTIRARRACPSRRWRRSHPGPCPRMAAASSSQSCGLTGGGSGRRGATRTPRSRASQRLIEAPAEGRLARPSTSAAAARAAAAPGSPPTERAEPVAEQQRGAESDACKTPGSACPRIGAARRRAVAHTRVACAHGAAVMQDRHRRQVNDPPACALHCAGRDRPPPNRRRTARRTRPRPSSASRRASMNEPIVQSPSNSRS